MDCKDSIKIKGLEVYAGHGVFAKENKEGQMFLIDAVLFTDIRKAGLSDDLSYSTDYGEVCHFISRFFRQQPFFLIEAASEQLAMEILLAFPLIFEVEVRIHKPHAPIGLPFSDVSVEIRRGWKKAYLGIGSNMGDKKRYLEEAIGKIGNHRKIRNVECAEMITTAPYGGVKQDDFLNSAIGLETLLTPYELLAFLQELEGEAGRERLIHWGPRTLDLDILFYQDFLSDAPDLTVPHPDMENRMFVLEPLSQLCPYYLNPVTGKCVKQMLMELSKEMEK